MTTILTTGEYEALMVFLAHAKPRKNRKKDLDEIANRYTDTALDEMLSAASKIVQAVQVQS